MGGARSIARRHPLDSARHPRATESDPGVPTMSIRTHLAGPLFGTLLCMAAQASGAQPADLPAASALQAGISAIAPRYELGAVVDVRQANRNGIAILAVTPVARPTGWDCNQAIVCSRSTGIAWTARQNRPPRLRTHCRKATAHCKWKQSATASHSRCPDAPIRCVLPHRATAATCGYVSTQAGVPPRDAAHIPRRHHPDRWT